MGLNDRDYAREPSSGGFHLQAPQSGVGLLLFANVAIYVVDMFSEGRLAQWLALSSDLFHEPWNCWQLLTYGFVHDPNNIMHLVGNMFLLWFFGGEIERIYGRNEFLRFYAAAMVAGGLVWVASQTWLMPDPAGSVVGASGAVTGVWMLYLLHFPTRTIFLFGIVAMPMWIFGLFNIVPDLIGFIASLRGLPTEQVAFECHLGGALFALAYRKFNWNFGRWLPQGVAAIGSRRSLSRAPLKIHEPAAEERPSLEAEVDRILEKISVVGTDGLSADEKRTLERASARYQKRRS
jgi:membrane associated rhomboid family serine protease